MGRAPCYDKSGLKKGPWTPEEDLKLINYVQIHGPGNWRTLPKNAGLQRCGKSCRLRWANYLRPDIKRGRFTLEEEDIIVQLHSIMGNKWSAIAGRLPGRTDNEIKNYWNTHIKKRLLRMGVDPITHAPRLDLFDMSSILSSVLGNPSLLNMQGLLGAQVLMNPELLKLAATASLLSIKHENTDLASQNHVSTPQEFPQFQTPMKGFLGNMANLSCSNSPLNSGPSSLGDNLVLQQNKVVHNGNQNMGFDSVLATPDSSPKQVNSSSNYVNCGMEELQRDSYCGDLFKFEIPESLDMSDIFCSVPLTN